MLREPRGRDPRPAGVKITRRDIWRHTHTHTHTHMRRCVHICGHVAYIASTRASRAPESQPGSRETRRNAGDSPSRTCFMIRRVRVNNYRYYVQIVSELTRVTLAWTRPRVDDASAIKRWGVRGRRLENCWVDHCALWSSLTNESTA